MRAVIQRVSSCSVSENKEEVSQIDLGLLILLGIESRDEDEDLEWLVKKISQLRIFGDDEGKMNLDINEVNGDAIVVSQFTLHAQTKKGNRPSYIRAARPEMAEPMYEQFISKLNTTITGEVKGGVFGAMMSIDLINEGPVTIIIDTKNKE